MKQQTSANLGVFLLPSKLLVFDPHLSQQKRLDDPNISKLLCRPCTLRDIISKGTSEVSFTNSLRNSSSSSPKPLVSNGRFGRSPYWRFVDVAAAFLWGRYGTSATWCHQTCGAFFVSLVRVSEVCEWNILNEWFKFYQFTESGTLDYDMSYVYSQNLAYN